MLEVATAFLLLLPLCSNCCHPMLSGWPPENVCYSGPWTRKVLRPFQNAVGPTFKKVNTAVQKQIDNLPPSVSAFLDLKTSEFRANSFNCFGFIHTHIISVTRLTALRVWHIKLQCCLCCIGAGYVLLALLQLYCKLANTVKFCSLSCLMVTDFIY